MTRSKYPIDESLPDDAKAIMGTLFAVTPVLTFNTPSIISARAKVALDALVAAGAIVAERGRPTLTYRRCVPPEGYDRWARRNKALCKWSLTDPASAP